MPGSLGTSGSEAVSAEEERSPKQTVAKRILTRFAHLLSAQIVDAACQTLFYIYLARVNSEMYGQVMYAIAAASFLFKVVQYGLYYTFVRYLTKQKEDKIPETICQVQAIRAALLVGGTLVVWCFTYYRNLSPTLTSVVLLVGVGHSLEALAETYFAYLRVKGHQRIEARIRITAIILAYGWGVSSVALGLSAVFVGMFRLVSGVVCLSLGLSYYVRFMRPAKVFASPSRAGMWEMFRYSSVFALIEILGVVYNKMNVLFLESATGITGVAYYSAANSLTDGVCILTSEQLLGGVTFPLLAGLWWKSRGEVGPLVRRTSQWLLIVAFPIMHILYMESDFIIGLIYPAEYKDSVWMLQYLIWKIPLSFQNNLFSYLMIVAGGARMLLLIVIVTTLANLIYNLLLVNSFGLAGGCLVLVLTKLTSAVLTFGYVQLKFGYFRARDLTFPLLITAGFMVSFSALQPFLGTHTAGVILFTLYGIVVWKVGPRFLGRFAKQDGTG